MSSHNQMSPQWWISICTNAKISGSFLMRVRNALKIYAMSPILLIPELIITISAFQQIWCRRIIFWLPFLPWWWLAPAYWQSALVRPQSEARTRHPVWGWRRWVSILVPLPRCFFLLLMDLEAHGRQVYSVYVMKSWHLHHCQIHPPAASKPSAPATQANWSIWAGGSLTPVSSG